MSHMHPKQLFIDMLLRRKVLLSAFNEVNNEFFHTPLQENTWTPKSLFRHILAGMTWMAGTMGNSSFDSHPLALMTAQNIDESVGLKEVKIALEDITQKLIEVIDQVKDDTWKEIKSTPLRKNVSRETSFISLVYHELEHIGQIKWILKRLTGWTDKEIYTLRAKIENSNKD